MHAQILTRIRSLPYALSYPVEVLSLSTYFNTDNVINFILQHCFSVVHSFYHSMAYTVETPITDPPRSGQPPYSGHTPCYGLKLQ